MYLVDSTVQCLNNWDKTNTQGLKITEENENVLTLVLVQMASHFSLLG